MMSFESLGLKPALLRALTDAGGTSTRGETVVLAPSDAAARIVQALRNWGYLV
jgi:hypothetical protein